ncbi:MAG: hypothetical protein ABIJ30_01205, partial [bacterium]
NSKNTNEMLNLEELGLKGKLVKAYKIDKPGFDLACVLWTKEQKLFEKNTIWGQTSKTELT